MKRKTKNRGPSNHSAIKAAWLQFMLSQSIFFSKWSLTFFVIQLGISIIHHVYAMYPPIAHLTPLTLMKWLNLAKICRQKWDAHMSINLIYSLAINVNDFSTGKQMARVNALMKINDNYGLQSIFFCFRDDQQNLSIEKQKKYEVSNLPGFNIINKYWGKSLKIDWNIIFD